MRIWSGLSASPSFFMVVWARRSGSCGRCRRRCRRNIVVGEVGPLAAAPGPAVAAAAQAAEQRLAFRQRRRVGDGVDRRGGSRLPACGEHAGPARTRAIAAARAATPPASTTNHRSSRSNNRPEAVEIVSRLMTLPDLLDTATGRSYGICHRSKTRASRPERSSLSQA